MKRRDLLTLFGAAAAAWPVAARAQQAAVPLIGYLNGASFGAYTDRVARVLQGLRQTGFIEGKNVAIEYRSAEGQYDRLPALAAELVHLQVSVILAVGPTNSARAAKAAASTIPIVFTVGSDPVVTGLVSNLARPEANLTGVTQNFTALAPKRLEIARELLPTKKLIGYLRNPENPFDTEASELTSAAHTLGLEVTTFQASTDRDLPTAFDSMVQQRIDALIVSTDDSLTAHRSQIAALAAHHAIPTIYPNREYVSAGGLISYGVEFASLLRQAGIYVGRILKVDKPADLPIVLPTKFESWSTTRPRRNSASRCRCRC